MGASFLADIPGNAFRVVYHNAAIASDGAASRFAMFRAPANLQITAAYWVPYGADQGADTGSYRKLSIVNGGTDGTATTVVASIALTASKASFSINALTGSATVAASAAVVFSQTTVGGDDATGTVLRAGVVQVEYQLL